MKVRKLIRDCAITFVVVFGILATLFATYVIVAPKASADPGYDNCENIAWPTLLNWGRMRAICDGELKPDGSWLRARVIWTPAHQVPLRTNCYGTYSLSCTTTGGYYQPTVTHEEDSYIVFPSNVLPDEPGWLGPKDDTVVPVTMR